MDKSIQILLYENSCCDRKTETFANMKILNIQLRQYVLFVFSSHLQVINKVYEQWSAN